MVEYLPSTSKIMASAQSNGAEWCTPVVPVLGRRKLEGRKSKVILGLCNEFKVNLECLRLSREKKRCCRDVQW